MRPPPRAAGLVVALLSAVTARAGEAPPPRCAVLGPVVVSGWLALAPELGRGTPEAAAASIARLGDATALYQRMGCDMDRLHATIDCVTERLQKGGAPGPVASLCISEAGGMGGG